MNKEDKELLLKDLSARLPYGVIMQMNNHNYLPAKLKSIDIDKELLEIGTIHDVFLDACKPYLRHLSSMTEEEFTKLKKYSGLIYDQLDLASFQNGAYKCLDFYLNEVPSYVVIKVFDWLNRNHFDYRDLISKGLALEAPEGMYK